MNAVFSELTTDELRELESTLKRVGKHAEKLWTAGADQSAI